MILPQALLTLVQVKSHLNAARARLEQLKPQHDAQPRAEYSSQVHAQAVTVNIPGTRGTPGTLSSSESSQPMLLRSLSTTDQVCNRKHAGGKSCRTDDNNITTQSAGQALMRGGRIGAENVEEDYNLCVICIENAPQVRFQPCAHVVTCKPCASKVLLQTGECPMCRSQLSALELI